MGRQTEFTLHREGEQARTQRNDRNRRQFLRATAGIAAGTVLAGCTDGNGNGGADGMATPTGTEAQTSLTFGAPKGAAAGVSPRVVRDQGFADERGIDLTLELAAPPQLFTRLQGKKIESSTFPVISGARLANQGQAIRLFQPVARSFNSIIARKGEGLSSVSDLKDVTLGSMPKKTAPFTHFALLLSLEGFDVENFEIQFGPPPLLFGKMKQGELDAIIGVEPFSTRLLATGNYTEFFVFNDVWRERKGSDMPLVEAATYQSSLDRKPDAFKGFPQALSEAGQYIDDNTRAVFERYADALGLQNDEQIQLAVERIAPIYPPTFSTELRQSGKEVVRLAAKQGLIPEEPSLEELFVDPRDL